MIDESFTESETYHYERIEGPVKILYTNLFLSLVLAETQESLQNSISTGLRLDAVDGLSITHDTVLERAASYGNVSAFSLFLDHNILLDSEDALLFAIRQNSSHLVHLVFELGVDVTAAHFEAACMLENSDMVISIYEHLQANNYDLLLLPPVSRPIGRPEWIYSMIVSESNVLIEYFVLDGLSANTILRGVPLLFWAVAAHAPRIVELLLSHGANVLFTRVQTKETILHAIATPFDRTINATKFRETLQLLCAAGATTLIDNVTSTGNSCYQVAAMSSLELQSQLQAYFNNPDIKPLKEVTTVELRNVAFHLDLHYHIIVTIMCRGITGLVLWHLVKADHIDPYAQLEQQYALPRSLAHEARKFLGITRNFVKYGVPTVLLDI